MYKRQDINAQGKRIDLYIYKESVLADARYHLAKMQFFLLASLVGILFGIIMLMDLNPREPSLVGYLGMLIRSTTENVVGVSYGITTTVESRTIVYGLLGLGLSLNVFYLIYLSVKNYLFYTSVERRVSKLSNLFIKSYEEKISKSLEANLMLQKNIWSK